MPAQIMSRNHPGFWNQRLAALVCITICLMPMTCCNAETPGSSSSSGSEISGLRQKLQELSLQEKALQEEFVLARESRPYLVIHASSGTIELKARGRILRSFNIKEIADWEMGNTDAVSWMLNEMKPIQKSERPKIKPGAGEEATAEAAKNNLWGLHRMPMDYDLVCSDGNILEIRGLPAEESGLRLVKPIQSLYRRSIDRYRRWKAPDKAELQHSIRLWLDENDSRLLFWSLPKQMKILVLSQSDPPVFVSP